MSPLLSNLLKLPLAAALAFCLSFGLMQLITTPAMAATCVCPAQLWPGCTYTSEYTYWNSGRVWKCCVYSCGAEYCGIDGPGNC
ncbi:MAG: hypothetical protein QNK37_38830 [Acidobacteriota bacterium]|nr:hypothetical protein [Acidobacteriota bacterium]